MSKRPRNQSVTTRSRTGERYWVVLAVQLLLSGVVTVYLGIVALTPAIALSGFLTGVVLAVAGVVGVAVYPALFKDVVYVNRGNFGWRPRWWRYFGIGFGLTFLAYVGVRTVGRDETLAPVALLFVHMVASTLVSASYLYNRRRTMGIP
jgi:uncharacterized membrane-anchored protein